MRNQYGSLSSQGSNAYAPTATTPNHAATSHGRSATSPDRTQNKCATVTMMLAERIIRHDWSVEDEHFFESNHMNVWQTLEFLSGINLRKRYNYEGYSDLNNSIRTLTTSWRRDSFAEKNVSPNGDESSASTHQSDSAATTTANGKYTVESGNVKGPSHTGVNTPNGALRMGGAGGGRKRSSSCKAKRSKNSNAKQRETKSARKASAASALRIRRSKKKPNAKESDPEYALSPSDYADLIKCTFNLPRISAALERLMGTNVVRLTDRNYMKELRERIEDDYRQNLQKRIKARELKEVERERILIIEGKTKVIPDELADDPIFVVDKKADLEIIKSRAKLKTNREKNSERLKLQGVKWEKERQQHEQEETQRIDELRQRFADQHELEEQYTNEDATKGMQLLRIHDEEWRPCEQRLKEFLEQERAKMKERSFRTPTPFTTDPKDMQNILRARKRFQETEMRIRKHIDEQQKQQQIQQQLQQLQKQKSPMLTEDGKQHTVSKHMDDSVKPSTTEAVNDNIALTEETSVVRKNLASDEASDVSSGESFDEGSTISMAKQRYAQMLQQELESDVAEGLLISKDQYDHLRYEDEKIMQLRNARDIRELYQLAEEIIIGERIDTFADEGEEEEEAD